MGHRCPAPLKFLWLALALGQASLLGSQQATPAPEPASPASAANSTAGAQEAPTEPADFQKDNLSHLRLQRGDRTFDVYLYAADEKTEVLDFSSFFGNEGARQFSGHFQLLSVAGNSVVSKLDLDPDDAFVEKKPHNGARLFRDPKSGQDLVVIFQYGTSNCESVQFFSADPSGRLFLIPFLDRDGRTWKQMLTGPDGAIPHLANGAMVFCSYANVTGYTFCDAYAFDGANFLEASKWVTQDFEAPIKGLNDSGQAARALFDFLYALSAKEYTAAAYHLDPNVKTADAGSAGANRGQKAAFLESYCTVMGGQCLEPKGMESKASADAKGALLFQVSFETSDYQPLKIDARSSFDFRVAKTSSGFKVFDLPPR
jgi:hypothetical protein